VGVKLFLVLLVYCSVIFSNLLAPYNYMISTFVCDHIQSTPVNPHAVNQEYLLFVHLCWKLIS